jgi:phosphoribosylaminoimidazolecarboxamide formyltransferase/IMP cyclohydrolase
MSRVDARSKAAVLKKAGASSPDSPLKGSVVASDAFFPVPGRAGRGRSRRLRRRSSNPAAPCATRKSWRAADDHGIAMVFTGRRHFRH